MQRIFLNMKPSFTLQRTILSKNLVPAQKNFSPTLQRTIFYGLGGISKNSFQFTTDIFSEKNRGLLDKSENKNAPGLGKSGSIVFYGYEILENTASTAAVRTQRRNERSGLSASLLICSCWEHPNPYKNATLLLLKGTEKYYRFKFEEIRFSDEKMVTLVEKIGCHNLTRNRARRMKG